MENSYQMPPHGDVQVQYDTPQSAKPQSNAGSHQRTYQACIPCRERKVRCDLGPVDNPHDPPCVRCRRESKECYFSKTRRKKKADGEAASDENTATYEIKDGRKRVKVSTDEVENEPYGGDDVPRTPGGSIGMAQPLRRPTGPKAVQYGEEDQKASEETVARLQATEVHGGHDALKLLFEAASSTHNRKGSKESGPRPSFTNGVSPASLPSVGSPTITEKANGSYTSGPMAMLQNDPMWKTNVNPTSNPLESIASIDQEGYNSALKAWSRFRFVRAGWFTAKEAIDYIDYFHRHLSPLTPIVISTYQPYDTHEKLLTTEPMLTVVLLLIASRHMKLEGPGSVSRPYSIHQKLWSYLSGMVNRVLWGQEQFGGGFCGAGAEAASDVNPLTRKGLRTLGTIESLILLTEWHPRAMHFPPDEADEELMVPGEPLFQSTDANAEAAKGIGGQRMDAWLEPCWRSDRLCWMLLGLSMSLAFEIGVFDASEWQRHARSAGGHPLSADEMQAYDLRRSTVKNLLLVYVTQTSGRLGLTSMLPSNYSKPEDSTLFKQQLGQHHSIQEEIVHFWLRMAHLMREGNQRIYANKAFTRDLIKSGDYKTVLESLQEPLRRWREDFDKCGMPKHMRHILEIEYEYCRVYINALALQAVAERCANEQLFQNSSRPVEVNGPAANAIPPQTLAKLLGGDRNYMLQVGDAARNLLKVVVNGLYPGEFLRHAPVRTYFRIISASIVLLKSFSLGASESDVSDSLSLMDKTVEALRGCIVDDVHVASRFADLLDTLTQSLKPRLVRIAADGRSKSRRHSRPGSPEPVHTPLGLADQKLQAHKRKISGSFPTQQQQWPYSNDNMHGLNSTMPPSNSLFGVSNDIYDLTGPDNNFSIMPPPSFVYNSPAASLSQNMNTSPGNTGYDAFNEQDWLALPLDPIINMNGFNQNVDVSQGQFGPDVGGMDMLELLLNGNNANHWQ